MLFKQIIDFELRDLSPLVVHELLQLVIFLTKQKSLRKIFKWIIIYCLNIAQVNIYFFSLPGPNNLPILTPKCKIILLFWTKILRRRRIEQFNFFNWLSNVKNLVLSNGFKHVRNLIKWY